MFQFQTLIRSRDSPLNIQTLISVVFIDATMPLLELTSGLVEKVPGTNKTWKILLLIMCVVFLKITTFLWRILILHNGLTSLVLETVTIKFRRPRGRGAVGRVPTYEAEKNKYHVFCCIHNTRLMTLLMNQLIFYGCYLNLYVRLKQLLNHYVLVVVYFHCFSNNSFMLG